MCAIQRAMRTTFSSGEVRLQGRVARAALINSITGHPCNERTMFSVLVQSQMEGEFLDAYDSASLESRWLRDANRT
jgi:hypothetical protein